MKNLFSLRHGCFRALPFLLVLIFAIGATNAKAVPIYAVSTGNQLVRFDSSTPGTLVTVGPVTGLQAGENILGADFRPATGQLFALGSTSRLYVINKTSGSATLAGVLSTPLNGVEFGFDFNPTVDRIRIVSNTGQNLRVNPTNGVVTVDGSLNPGTPHATAAAYTNSFSGSTTTTLFDIDTASGTLLTQNPPNAGTLVTVGPLGVTATDSNGFDISAATGTAFAALTVGGSNGLYTINTATGSASLVGLIGAGTTSFRGLSADVGSPVQNLTVYGLTTSNQLVKFNSQRPNTILNTLPVTGLQVGESLIGIDFRPATGQLYASGNTGRLYTLNPSTGAAAFVATTSTSLSGTEFGIDFNPVPDRLRIVSDADQNLRINPLDGTATVDTILAFAVGDANNGQNPNIVGAGYTNSFAGATATTLYDIDSNLDILVAQNPPNNGTLNTLGPLGVNSTSIGDLDIAPGNNTALAALQQTGDTASKLYAVNLTTGAASLIGPVGTALPLRGIAIFPGSAASTTVDFDGDGRTDNAVFSTTTSNWLVKRSSNASTFNTVWGLASDILAPGDYDGDGKTDIAVWRPTDGFFYVVRSSDSQFQYFQFGLNGDEPVARDYDGDGKTDFAVVRNTGGVKTWFIANSSNGTFRADQFGASTDIVTPGDYDGDGKYDLAVRRGTGNQQATFFIQASTAGFSTVLWGVGGDLVVPGDYDGDGKTDITALRQGTTMQWHILFSSTGSFVTEQLGSKPQIPAQGDYDADGKTDVAVWDPLSGTFVVLRSATRAVISTQLGQNGDNPIAGFDTH